MTRAKKTAAEMIDELANRSGVAAQSEQRLRAVAEARKAVQPVLDDLARVGFEVPSLAELQSRGSYNKAIPTLLRWLPLVSNLAVKQAIVRALSVPFAKPAAAPVLINEFRRTSVDQRALKWSIGNALEVVADDSVFEDVVELVRDRTHGKAREMLAAALGNMSNPDALRVLVELLDDDEVAGHALIGLATLGDVKACVAIERFLKHPKPWVRNEALKALKSIAQVDSKVKQ